MPDDEKTSPWLTSSCSASASTDGSIDTSRAGTTCSSQMCCASMSVTYGRAPRAKPEPPPPPPPESTRISWLSDEGTALRVAATGSRPSRSARRYDMACSHVRGISWPTDGSSRGSREKIMSSRRERSSRRLSSPPSMHETQQTSSCTRSRGGGGFEPSRTDASRTVCSRWRWSAALSQLACACAALRKASADLSFGLETSLSQCVITGCTTASGAPTVR